MTIYTFKTLDKVAANVSEIPVQASAPTWLLPGTWVTETGFRDFFISKLHIFAELITTIPVSPLITPLAKGATLHADIDDALRVLRLLSLEGNKKSFVESQMSAAFARSPDTKIELSRLMVEIRLLEAKQGEQAVDSQSSLIRADVLEWTPGAQVQAVGNRIGTLKSELIALLDLGYLVGGSGGARGGGVARVIRS